MNEFIYNTDTIVNTAASPSTRQSFLGYELCDQKDQILTTKVNEYDFSNESLDTE